MRVLLTGASGFIGSAILPELLASGHTVVGMARSQEAAAQIKAAGADDVVLADLQQPDSVRRAVEGVDGVIHCGFVHDWVNHSYQQTCEIDTAAVTAMAEVLSGSHKPLVITSGTGVAGVYDRLCTEDDKWLPSPMTVRGATEKVIQQAASDGVRASIVRLPPTVHGNGDKGFVAMAVSTAREKGVSCYVGDGQNVWPAVHRLDAAKLFVLALEKGEAGAVYHGVADEAVPLKQIAEVIASKLHVSTKSLQRHEAAAHFGLLAMVAGLNNPTSSQLTQQRLGWTPTQLSLLDDLTVGQHYFPAPTSSAQ